MHLKNYVLTLCSLIFSFAATSQLAAQGCVDVPVQFTDWRFADVRSDIKSNEGGAVSPDGSAVFIYAVPNDAAADQAAELYAFDPATGQARALTQGTRVVDDDRINGLTRFPRVISDISIDGRFLFENAAGYRRDQNSFSQDQVLVFDVVSGPVGSAAEIIDALTGARMAVGGLRNRTLGINQRYVAKFGAYFGNANAIALTESIVTVQREPMNGVDQLRVISQDAAQASVIDIQTGLPSTAPGTDILTRLNAALAPDEFNSISLDRDPRISQDGNIVAFISLVALDVPGRPRVRNLPGNISRSVAFNYAFLNLENRFVRIGEPDLSLARPEGTPSTIFIRNIGRTGRVLPYAGGLNWVGQVPNPTFQAVPAFVRLGENPRYIVPPLAQIPERGIFTNSLAYISRDERRVYFSHTSDLVAGNNTGKSLELYSFEIASGRIRQITNLQDGLLERLGAQALREISDSSGSYQNIFSGASDDGRIVAFIRGGFVQQNTAVRVNGQIRVVSQPLGNLFRIVRCN